MDMMQVRRQMLMATPHEATASGNPATFDTDGVWPLKSLKVGFEPVQDLHGYDSPWPAGGGPNLLSSDNISRLSQTQYGVTYTVQADGSVKATGTVTTLTWNFASFYTTLDTYGLSVGDTISISAFGPHVAFIVQFYNENTLLGSAGTNFGAKTAVIPNDTTRIRLLVYCSDTTPPAAGDTIDKIIYPQLEKASTPSSVWHPYSNICPITGWTGMTVKCTGENLITCNGTSETVNGVTFEHDGNSVHISGANTSGKVVRHTFSTDLVYKQGLVLTGVPGMKPDGLYGTTSAVRPDPGYKNADVVKGKYYDSDIAQLYSWRVYVTADYDGTPFTYTPIVANGALYTVDWADEAGTIYGGTLDVVTGELVVDRAMVDMGTLMWGSYSAPYGGCFYATPPIGATQFWIGKCSQYAQHQISYVSLENCEFTTNSGAGYAMFVRDDAYTDTTSFKTAMSGVQLVYPLAAPITYHLTPQQIMSLVGENVVFSDTNGGCDVTYWVHGR